MASVIVIAAMVVVGLIIGALAGVIWKGDRPYGLIGDLLIAVLCTIVTGLIDWYVIPAMGFSETLKFFGILFEPALVAFLVLWLIRRSRK